MDEYVALTRRQGQSSREGVGDDAFAGETFRDLTILLPVEDASLAEHVGADVQNDLDADLETAFGRRLERVVGEE